ncbi:phage tail protein [Sphingomicrobium sp. XHP0239]|uniref:phage tail protein n=1 Tax=Sphingomicrobium maritimum TaxID=3133972 RepID=UPI0031CC3D29
MATLVLQSVGSAVGGPLGGAIGALVGQQIDQRVWGPGPRRGPRLGDLAVQGSHYGAAVPAIYGTMRVAGTIVWATDLQESEAVSGAKGQPDRITYSYNANFAIALSSRVKGSIGRVWADGKLLRGVAGDLKVPGVMRVLGDGEARDVDPLIASVEGQTPAYRDYLVVLFEGLELAAFGNRIPMLTFEVVADEAIPLREILKDATGGVLRCADERPVRGYAVHGDTIGDALEPLLKMVDRPIEARGDRLEISDTGASIGIRAEHLSAGAEEAGSPAQEILLPDARMPNRMAVDYYDPDRDYQAGRSVAHSFGGRREVSIEAPMVLSATDARSWCEDAMRRAWRSRRTLEVQLSPAHLDLRPGTRIRLGGGPSTWEVLSVEIERFVARIRARWIGDRLDRAVLPADPGRHLPSLDVERAASVVALAEPPDLDGSGRCVAMLACANASPGWSAVPVDVAVGERWSTMQSAGREAIIGSVEGALADGPSALVDRRSSLVVRLIDPALSLVSVGEAALWSGANMAMIGRELVQYQHAEAMGEGRFRLSGFLRGRRGTEDMTASHGEGEMFVPVDPHRMTLVDLDPERVGARVIAVPVGFADASSQEADMIFEGLALRPPSPVHLVGSTDGETLSLRWVRRSRMGFGWADGIDAPLGEAREAYRCEIVGADGTVTVETEQPSLSVSIGSLAPAGAGPWTVRVSQIGDRALSSAATITIEE